MQMVTFDDVGLLIKLNDVKLTGMGWSYSMSYRWFARALRLRKLKLFIPSRVPQCLYVLDLVSLGHSALYTGALEYEIWEQSLDFDLC